MAGDAVFLISSPEDAVLEVHFAPFEWATDCLAILTSSSVIVGCVQDVKFEVIKEIRLHSIPSTFAWSPETQIDTMPRLIKFVVGGRNGEVALYSLHDEADLEYKVIFNCESWVKSVSFSPDRHHLLAVGCEDNRCHIIDLRAADQSMEGQLDSSDAPSSRLLRLTSAGQRVTWHPRATGHLLVAERGGRLRMVDTDQDEMSGSVLTVESLCSHSPIADADWTERVSSGLLPPDDSPPCLLAALTASGLCVLTMDRPSGSLQKVPSISGTPGKEVRWSPSNPQLLATISGRDNMLRVVNINLMTAIPSSTDLDHCGSFSWHRHRPLLAVARYYNIYLYYVDHV